MIDEESDFSGKMVVRRAVMKITAQQLMEMVFHRVFKFHYGRDDVMLGHSEVKSSGGSMLGPRGHRPPKKSCPAPLPPNFQGNYGT